MDTTVKEIKGSMVKAQKAARTKSDGPGSAGPQK